MYQNVSLIHIAQTNINILEQFRILSALTNMCKRVNILSKYIYKLSICLNSFLFLTSLPRSSREAYVFNVLRRMRAIFEKSKNNIVLNCIE